MNAIASTRSAFLASAFPASRAVPAQARAARDAHQQRVRCREFGNGYGNSSGYARSGYTSAEGFNARFRCA
jgi:hypothetical protein